MKELFPKDIFPEPPEKVKKPIQNPAAGLWGGFVGMALITILWFFCLNQINSAMQPGLAHYNQGNYPAAETDFRKFTQNEWTAEDPKGHYYLGLCLLHEGQFEEGRTELKRACEYTGKHDFHLYSQAEKLLRALKELPANPTAVQTQEWQSKYLTQHHGIEPV